MTTPMYGEQARALQDRFDSRRLADRLEQVTVHDHLTATDQALVARCPQVYLATVDKHGWPDVSYKGGVPGFVRVLDRTTLALPSYDGNGMFRSLGAIQADPRVGLLFIDVEEPDRMRVQGQAGVSDDPELLASFEGAQLVVRIDVERVWPNCPRYVHRATGVEISPYAPQPGHEPPVPEWKLMELFSDVLPER
ncbi:MAG: pyridoxamine 5-phosphate oxidase family protein [Frankiales bacterium]|nr:pyridoxamine 5-phosphate oxidase family protein [Frankiales bacterium]